MSDTSSPVNEIAPETSARRLVGHMGVAQLVVLVLAFASLLATTVGYIPLAIGVASGVVTPLVFLLLAVAMAVFTSGYVAVVTRIQRAGGVYTIVSSGLNPAFGLATSFVATLGTFLGMVALSIFAGISTSGLLMSFGLPELPWWIFTAVYVAVAAVLGYFQIDVSAKTLLVLLVIDIVVVVVYDVVVAVNQIPQGAVRFDVFNPGGLLAGGAVVGFVMMITAFGGLETLGLFRDEVREPKKTLPRAGLVIIVLLAVVYTFSAWMLIASFGGGEEAVAATAADPAGSFLTSVGLFFGPVAGQVVNVIVLLAILAGVVAMHNVLSRYLFNLGIDRILPRAVGRPHPRHGSPYIASLVLTIVTVAVLFVIVVLGLPGVEVYTVLIGIGGLFYVGVLLLGSIAIAAYLIRTHPKDLGVFRRVVLPILSIAITATLLVLVTMNLDVLTGSSVLSAFAIVLPLVAVALGLVVGYTVRARNRVRYNGLGIR